MEIFALILPWLWIAAALVVMWLAGRSPRPGPPTVFALAMVMWGVSEFFVTPGAAPPWWLLAWKVACVATAGGSFLYLYASRLRQDAGARGRAVTATDAAPETAHTAGTGGPFDPCSTPPPRAVPLPERLARGGYFMWAGTSRSDRANLSQLLPLHLGQMPSLGTSPGGVYPQ